MNKLKKLIKASALLIRKPYLLNKVIDDNEVWKARVEKQITSGGLPEVRFSDLGQDRELRVKPFAFMEGGSLPTDLGLLKLLAGKFEACKYFEIGTWRGESVANVADVASDCTTLNLPDSEMEAAGLAAEYIDQHAMFSKGLANVQQLYGNSLTFDFKALNTKYDLIFIDGDHHYASIKKDTEHVFEHLVHEKSIVVWHDYAWQPGNVRHETMAAIIDALPKDLHRNLYAVRNTLCAIYYPEEVKAAAASVIAKKEEAFSLSIIYD